MPTTYHVCSSDFVGWYSVYGVDEVASIEASAPTLEEAQNAFDRIQSRAPDGSHYDLRILARDGPTAPLRQLTKQDLELPDGGYDFKGFGF